MRFWWVNHKQTFRHEFGGKYVWCPKLKTNGRPSYFYEMMREVKPGDLVFSYANAALQGFGFAVTHCYSCPRPNEFGRIGTAWDLRGWRADVNFRKFLSPLRTADHSNKIAPLLPARYSPLQDNGFGNQGAYFAEIDKTLALLIAELASPELLQILKSVNESATDQLTEVALPILQEWEDQQQKNIESEIGISQTTRKALIQARIGQGIFKRAVYRNEHACRITKVENLTHLVASHIKPWRESNNEERLSENNGLLLTPSIDHLFDRGFISFDDNGELITSPTADKISLKRIGIETNQVINVGQFNSDQKHFLDYHRREILLKSAS